MSIRTFPDLEQGSDAWHAQRRGMVTASAVGKLIASKPAEALSYMCSECGALIGASCLSKVNRAPIKTPHANRGPSSPGMALPSVLTVSDGDEAKGLTALLAAERITGWAEETPMTSDMWRGVEAEPFARDLYSQHFAEVTQVGFMIREERGWQLGFSPDGLVGDEGLIEIKAPRPKTHLRTILADQVPAHYLAQCQAGLLVSGRNWLDYVSFVGGMPLYRHRVYPDQQWFDVITAACTQAEQNITAMVADYTSRVVGLPATERIDLELKVA